MPRELVDLLDAVGWFLPFLALIIPVSLILFFVLEKAAFLVLIALQFSGMYFGLHAMRVHLRHSGFSSDQIRIMLVVIYFIACFATNIVIFLGFGLVHKFW